MARLQSEEICARKVIAEVCHPGAGCVLTFAGTVRDEHLGREVTAIEYHAYSPMALRELNRIEDEVHARWPALRAVLVHRTGLLRLGEVSVLIAVAAPHRPEGFDALRFAIEQIKENVPIWKKEFYTNGHAWIEGS